RLPTRPTAPKSAPRPQPMAMAKDGFDAAPAPRQGQLAPLTEADAKTIGSSFGKSRPPQAFWNDYAAEMTLARGIEQGGITQPQMAANAVLATKLLTADGSELTGPAKTLTPADLSATLRASGVPLSRQDPSQLIAATSYA